MSWQECILDEYAGFAVRRLFRRMDWPWIGNAARLACPFANTPFSSTTATTLKASRPQVSTFSTTTLFCADVHYHLDS